MRVYTAKPRTNGEGYKGLMHQPDTSKLPDLINGIVTGYVICITVLLLRQV